MRVFDRYGVDALNYGYGPGPGPLLDWLSAWIAKIDHRGANPDEISICAGVSHGLDQVMALFTLPGDIALIESPTYHLAIRILREHGVDLVPVELNDGTISIDSLRNRIRRLRAAGRTVRLLYTVPTFGNPTGLSTTEAQRRELAGLASEEGFFIVEDDAYRELWYESPPPPSLWSIAPPGVVIRLGSFAKSLAPGLRCGFITSDAKNIERIRASGVLDSGGGISHLGALVVAEFAGKGDYSRNVQNLRSGYRERRDALLNSLAENVAGKVSWSQPAGGYFVWLTLAKGNAATLLTAAESNGTAFLPGDVFMVPPMTASRNLRLSFSRYSPPMLREAGRRLGVALRHQRI